MFVGSAADPLLAVEAHRQFTHALSFILVGGAVASLPWLARRKHPARWRPLLGAATAAYATHGLLDACTTYGTQLLWPFSSLHVAWNCISSSTLSSPSFSSGASCGPPACGGGLHFTHADLDARQSRIRFGQHFRQSLNGATPTAMAPHRMEGAVQVMTCHAAKGLEFPCVVVAGQTLS